MSRVRAHRAPAVGRPGDGRRLRLGLAPAVVTPDLSSSKKAERALPIVPECSFDIDAIELAPGLPETCDVAVYVGLSPAVPVSELHAGFPLKG